MGVKSGSLDQRTGDQVMLSQAVIEEADATGGESEEHFATGDPRTGRPTDWQKQLSHKSRILESGNAGIW